MKKILLCIMLFTSSTQAGFISLNLWQKGNQKVAVLGDQCCDIVSKTKEKLWPEDKKHWFVLRTCLGKINSNESNKTALLVDATDDFRDPGFDELKKSQTAYIGMHMQLNRVATSGEYKSIKTVSHDLRGLVIDCPMQFIATLEKIPSLPASSPEVAKKLETFREMVILDTTPKVTLKKYLEKLGYLETEHKISHPAITAARKFFAAHSSKNNPLIGDLLWQNRKKSVSDQDFYAKNAWIFELNDQIATAGIKKALPEALNNHQSVLLYAGQAHAVTANQHMKELGYAPVVSAGKQKRIEAPEDQVLSPDLLEEVLNKFRSDESYCICEKPAEKKCARCKEIYYCSKECQTSDWKNHKVTCAKK